MGTGEGRRERRLRTGLAIGMVGILALVLVSLLARRSSPLPGGLPDQADDVSSAPTAGDDRSSAYDGATGTAEPGDSEDLGNTTSYIADGDLPTVASGLLGRYRDEGEGVLTQAGYLDLLGRVWSCTVKAPDWVDVCVVSEGAEQGSCDVRVLRMDVESWERSYGEEQG